MASRSRRSVALGTAACAVAWLALANLSAQEKPTVNPLAGDPAAVRQGQNILFQGPVTRTIRVLATTLAERGDPRGMFSAEVVVTPLQ